VVRGAKIINMFLPSSRGSRSTVARGVISSAMRSSNRRPNAVYDRYFDLAPVDQEALGHTSFRLVIVRLDLRPQLHFAEFEVALLFARVLIFFRLLVFESSVITDFDDGRLCIWRDLDEIQTCSPSARKRLLGRHDAELFPIFVDHADRSNADLLVDS